jgi:hypothetical protein
MPITRVSVPPAGSGCVRTAGAFPEPSAMTIEGATCLAPIDGVRQLLAERGDLVGMGFADGGGSLSIHSLDALQQMAKVVG